MTLRLATVGGYTEAIIQRNAPIPTERTRLFTTSRDRQEMVSLRVYQGEEEQEEDNTLLGEFVFGPLPPRPRERFRSPSPSPSTPTAWFR